MLQKRRAVIIDLSIGLGIPLAQVIACSCFAMDSGHGRLYSSSFTDTIPQGHRYDIYEDIGCVPTVYNTPLAVVMFYIWPIVIGLISAVYCGEFSDAVKPATHD